MKQFEMPELEVVNFSVADVITTSGGGSTITPDDEF